MPHTETRHPEERRRRVSKDAGWRCNTGSDDALLLQGADFGRAEAEPGAEHFGIVLAEQGRWLDLWRRAVEAHWPGRHLDLAGGRVLDRLHDAARFERGIVHQFERVEHRAGRHPGFADQLHRLFLGVLAGPRRDQLVDLGGALAAGLAGFVTLVTLQILAPDNLEQTLPVLGIGAAGEHIDVIVRAARLARVEGRGHQPAGLRPVAAAAQLRLPGPLGAREWHAHVVDHRVLHRDLQPPPLAALLPLVQRAENADRHQHAGAGVAEAWAGLHRRAVTVAGDAGRAAGGLRDHVEGEVFLVGAAGAEALHLAIDDPGLELLDLVIAEAQPLDRARRHVLDRDIGLLQQLANDFEAARRFQIQRQRLLVGVELVEVPRVVVGLARLQAAARIAAARVLDLDHLGAEPGQAFGAGRPCLELGEIHHPDAFETIQLNADIRHRLPPVRAV